MLLTLPFCENLPHPDDSSIGAFCQEASLLSIIGYLMPEKNYSMDDVINITKRKPDKAAWAFAYSIWLVDNGFNVTRITTVDYKRFAKEGIDYIREAYGEEMANFQQNETDFELALELSDEYVSKVNIVNERPTVTRIVDAMKQGELVKLMIDLDVLNDSSEKEPHSVAVTGFTESELVIHDSGFPPYPDRHVEFELIQKAIDSFGGEMDLVSR